MYAYEKLLIGLSKHERLRQIVISTSIEDLTTLPQFKQAFEACVKQN